MNKNIHILGSIAYDNIIISDKPFSELIDTTVQHQIQGAFYTTTLKKEFGGCAGNIAYSLNLLNKKSNIYTSIGENDSDKYIEHLNKQSLCVEKIKIIKDEYTAQAHILNDLHNNQIISFYPGALQTELDTNNLSLNKNDIYILSPENKINILNFAKILYENNIEFLFDPGQALSTFTKVDLKEILPKTQTLILNDYELKTMLNMLDEDFNYLLKNVSNIIVTKGADGIELFSKDKQVLVSAYSIDNPIDPTGCGDGFRAGFIYGLVSDMSLIDACKYGNTVASFVVETHGTQNHIFTFQQIEERNKELKVIYDY